MSLSGLNLLAANHNSGAKKLAGIAQEGGQGAKASRGSESINNLAQRDQIDQAEEVSVNTGIKSRKAGSPTNIDGSEHAASGRGVSDVTQSAGQEADAEFDSYANNNQSEIAEVNQAEKVSTNLDIDVFAGQQPHGGGRHNGHGYGHGRGHGYGHGRGHGYGHGGHGYGYNHNFKGPDSIHINLDSHMASADLSANTQQDGSQLANANHGSESINNLKQAAATNQMEDVSVNSDVNIHGKGTVHNGPAVVKANDHTASGNAVATSVQSAHQTAISDNDSLAVNNFSQSNYTGQTEKVNVNTNVII